MQKTTFIHTKTSDTMARPVKTGLDYFPLPVDFFDDIRICAVAVEHGAKGQLAAIMLLVHLYKTSYYLKWDNVARVRLLKDMPGVTPAELDRIVQCLVEWDFFDKALFEQEHVLTSREVQRHFFHATKRRRNNTAQMPFLLTETDNLATEQQKLPVEGHERNDGRRQHAETGFSTTETAFQQTDSTQEYNKRVEIIKNYPLSSSSTSAHVKRKSNAESAVMVDNNAQDDDGNAQDDNSPSLAERVSEIMGAGQQPVTTPTTTVVAMVENDDINPRVCAEVEQLKANSQWMEMMCMHHRTTPMLLHQKLDEFARECLCRGKKGHNDIADAKSHFCNWLTIKTNQNNNNHNNSNNNNAYHETTRRNKTPNEFVADAQRWAYEETLRFLQSPERRSDDVQAGLPF